MFKDVTMGQYYPGNSALHRLDPRTKIVSALLFLVLVFIISQLWLYGAMAVFIAIMVAVAKIPARYFISTLKPLKWIIVFMFIINTLFTSGETLLVQWWIIRITQEGLLQGISMSVRLILLLLGSSLLTFTTSPIALTDGLERLLKPLNLLRFPVHELSMMMTIALRFIPTLMEETDKIQKAQMARGADFESGNVFRRARNMVPLLVPLFVSAFRRADELAMAMESRCYHGGKGRTRMKILRMTKLDMYAALVMLALSALIITVKVVF